MTVLAFLLGLVLGYLFSIRPKVVAHRFDNQLRVVIDQRDDEAVRSLNVQTERLMYLNDQLAALVAAKKGGTVPKRGA